MTSLAYTAKKNIITGHVVDALYSIDVRAKKLDNEFEENKKQHESIGGNVETIFFNEFQIWDIKLGSFFRTGGEGTLEQMREFMSSVQAGEDFTFDAYGSVAVPDNPQTVFLVSKGFKPKRLERTGKFDFNLTVRVR